jgi:hypothetical protein
MSEATQQAQSDGTRCEIGDTIGQLFRALGASEEACGHFQQSRIEFLKGIRTLLDERIEHLGRAPRKGTRVVVD